MWNDSFGYMETIIWSFFQITDYFSKMSIHFQWGYVFTVKLKLKDACSSEEKL